MCHHSPYSKSPLDMIVLSQRVKGEAPFLFISLLFSLILNRTSDMWYKGNPMVIKKKNSQHRCFSLSLLVFSLSLSLSLIILLFNNSTPPSSTVKLEKSLTHVSMLPILWWFSTDLITQTPKSQVVRAEDLYTCAQRWVE